MTTNTITSSVSPATRAAAFSETLAQIIPPADCSDRTAFRRVARWLAAGCEAGTFGLEIFPCALDLAREAAGPACRKPAAVFMSLLKRELGYSPKGNRHEQANPGRSRKVRPC